MLDEAVTLRGHHLLCMLSYIGKGYTAEFVRAFDGVIDKINRGAKILVLDGPDDLCRSMHAGDQSICPSGEHCFQQSAASRDQQASHDIAKALGISIHVDIPVTFTAAQCAQLRHLFKDGSLRTACVDCEWHELCTDIAAADFNKARLMPPVSF